MAERALRPDLWQVPPGLEVNAETRSMAGNLTAAERLEVLGGFAASLPDPCLILDRRAMVLYRNALAATEFPNATVGNLLTLAMRNPALHNALDTARRTDQSQTIELHQTVPNETWHLVHIAPLPGSDGMMALTLQNLSEQKRIESLRSDFIANASHELRTPLTSLIGFVDTLLGPAARDEEARERFLNIMRQQAARMSKLIDDLLSLSRIEMRQHVRPTASVELKNLLEEIRDGLETQAREAGVEIEIEAPAEMIVAGDREELYEVFENLIDNAVKYGGDGARVEVALGPGRNGYAASVTVTDHGPGVAPEHVPRLTERFYRVDAESSRKKKGTGLGLAIVKHIVNRHRGLMTIRSQPGEGMRVEVLLNQ
jgi:two-component system phosphate regulon sensor histidine kinase PhoR